MSDEIGIAVIFGQPKKAEQFVNHVGRCGYGEFCMVIRGRDFDDVGTDDVESLETAKN